MIVESSSNPQFLSNTYLVSDGEGGPAFFIDAGGPGEPLIKSAERRGLTPTHVLLTHHHFDHVCDVGLLRERCRKTFGGRAPIMISGETGEGVPALWAAIFEAAAAAAAPASPAIESTSAIAAPPEVEEP